MGSVDCRKLVPIRLIKFTAMPNTFDSIKIVLKYYVILKQEDSDMFNINKLLQCRQLPSAVQQSCLITL